MGVYVNIIAYDVEELEEYTVKKCGPDSLNVLRKAMDYFGGVFGDTFLILSDDHAVDYDSGYEFLRAIGLAHGLSYDDYQPPCRWIESHGNAEEFLDMVGVEYDEDNDW